MLYAVIWGDFGAWLWLKYESAEAAISAAQAMLTKSRASGVELHQLRAVQVSDDDKLTTLWPLEA